MPLATIKDRKVGIHALIVGISDYTYLPGDDDPARGGAKFGMKKLKAPSFGAFRFLQWLNKADEESRLVQPLASYDVVLAPSADERNVAGLAECIDDASTTSFIRKTWEWRERVATNSTNVAVFYFSGHGIQRNKDDAVLMLQDFAKPQGAILDNAVSFFDIFSGMAPSDDFRQMGMTQFYFVDACRNLPEQIKNFSKLSTRPVFDSYLGGRDDRAAPVFFAAVNDSVAFGEVGKGSYFNRALMTGLERGAESFKEVAGKTRWPISVYTLATAISHEFAKFQTDQNFVPTGHVVDREFCYLDQPPLVDLLIAVEPEAQRGDATIVMTQVVDPPLEPFKWEQPRPPPNHPYMLTAPAGIHKLSSIEQGVMCDKGFQIINQKQRLCQVKL
jgi:hypothetical protein